MSDTYLKHYGVLGMRWGVRRNLNKDGSFTSQTKLRMNKPKSAKKMSDEELSSSVKRLNMERVHNQLSSQNRKKTKTEKAKKVVDSTSTAVGQTKSLIKSQTKKEKLDLSNMTDQQLRERINRTNLERQYNDMFASQATVSKGETYATKVLDVAGTALAIGSSALGIALAIKELRN